MLNLVWLVKCKAIRGLITVTEESHQVLAHLRVEHEVVVLNLIELLFQQLFHFVKLLDRLIVEDVDHLREQLFDLTCPADYHEHILCNVAHFEVLA